MTTRRKPGERGESPSAQHDWAFRRRFRRGAFGWRSSALAVRRVTEAVREIGKEARKDPLLAAEGAVLFLERVSGALMEVDSSSGAVGSAVNRAIDALAAVIAEAPANAATREEWLERLWAASEADEMPYIETLGDHWGRLCASKALAAAWAERLMVSARAALAPPSTDHFFFKGTGACLSALFAAERYEELAVLLQVETIWSYRRWGVRALVALGRKVEAIRWAENARGAYGSDAAIDRTCEDILLSSGMVEEAYRRYALHPAGGTYLSAFRGVAERYPQKPAAEILADLSAATPGKEGKWFAAAKKAGLYDEALALATRSPCDPRTLSRAARDFAQSRPGFALEAGLLALHWIAEGMGYEVTGSDVHLAYTHTMKAAEQLGRAAEARDRVRALLARGGPGATFVWQMIGRLVERGDHLGAAEV